MYDFIKCDPSMIKGGSNILNVYAEESGEMHSLFIGQAMALFGEPDYMTKDYENIFTTSIMAVNEDGETVYLYVYHGPSGPAIGGKNDEKSRSAANELASLIMRQKPVDYKWKGFYADVGVSIKMGVKDGKPYYTSMFDPLRMLAALIFRH